MAQADGKLLLILLLAGIFLCWGITLPYVKAWETGALEFFAQNHILYGIHTTKGLPLVNFVDGHPVYYLSHPPLVPFLLFLSFKVCGTHEWSARLIPIIFSLFGLIFFYLLVAHISGKKVAFVASMFYLFMPMFSYYGRIVNYEAVTLAIIMLFLYSFVKFHTGRKMIFFLLLVGATVLGALSDWPFYLFFLTFSLYAGKREMRRYIGLMILLGVFFAGMVLFYRAAAVLSVRNQIHTFMYRCQYENIFTDFKFYLVLFKRALLNFTPLGCWLMCVWLWQVIRQRSFFNEEKNVLASILLLSAFLLIIGVPQAAYTHDWSFQYFVPGVALISASAVMEFKRTARIAVTALFFVFSLLYLGKLHGNKVFSGPYAAGKIIARVSLPGDILYTNTVSPLCFYAGLKTHFFALGQEKVMNPEEFISARKPKFVCTVKYAVEPHFDSVRLLRTLRKECYRMVYDKHEVALWQNAN